MEFKALLPYALAPTTAALGFYVLILCIARLRRVIFPTVRYRFSPSVEPYNAVLPAAGRYVISLLLPPLTFATGTSYRSVRFAVRSRVSGAAIEYRSYGLALFQANRTDMSGKKSIPLGAFECSTPGDFQIVCLNPETVRPDFELEISPYVSPLLVAPLIVATIVSSGMMIGGTVLLILGVAGKI